MKTAQKWHYNTHEIISRIPREIGQHWELGYGIKLSRFGYVKASSNFNGQHNGHGTGPVMGLAKDENNDYLLIRIS